MQVEIPPIGVQLRLVREAHASTGYLSGARLFELTCSRLFWNGMHRDCTMVAAASLTAQLEQVCFLQLRWLYPTKKGAQPFMYYALDCFV